MLDAQGRCPHPAILDDPHQLGQGRRSVPRTAKGGRQRRHQMVERIAQARPALMDVEERLDLQHGTDPTVTGTAMTSLEQPAVDLLALVPARLDGIGEGRLVKRLEIGEQPQLQRVYPSDIALIRQ